MKNNFFVFLGFALICLVNLSSSRKVHPSASPATSAPAASVVVPAADEVSAQSNGPGLVHDEMVQPPHPVAPPVSITK